MTISIHAPRTGSDQREMLDAMDIRTFQSTLPARGATSEVFLMPAVASVFQSTLPARGATCRRIADGTGRD